MGEFIMQNLALVALFVASGAMLLWPEISKLAGAGGAELGTLEATRLITTDGSLAETKVLILTTFELDEYVFEALRAGAAGFLLKDTEPVVLVRAVRVVAAGEALTGFRLKPTVVTCL